MAVAPAPAEPLSCPSMGREGVTETLSRARRGDAAANEALFLQVYDELRAVAAAYLRRERADHTLQPTALVHEAYLRAVDQAVAGLEDRRHFFAIAARVMRQVLIDHARKKGAARRGGDRMQITLQEDSTPQEGPAAVDLLALDDALEALLELDERKGRVVELRYFAGLSLPEVADALGISLSTAESDWYMARAWLRGELSK